MNNKPMKFDQKGIMASSPELASIAHQYLEELRRETERRRRIRECAEPADCGQWGTWNISDRH